MVVTFIASSTQTTGNDGHDSDTITVNFPSHLAGDLLIAWISTSDADEPTSLRILNEAGFTEIVDVNVSAPTGVGLYVAWHIAASDDEILSRNFNATDDTGFVATGIIYRGVDPVTPIDVQATGATQGNATSNTTPSVTTTVPNVFVNRIIAIDDNLAVGTTPSPGGYALRKTIQAAGPGNGVTGLLYDMVEPTSGATGTEVISWTDSDENRSFVFGLKPDTEEEEFEVDAILAARQTETFTVDARVGVFIEDFTVDAILKKTQTKVFTIDALLQQEQTEVFTVDAILVRKEEFTIDALLQASGDNGNCGSIVQSGTVSFTGLTTDVTLPKAVVLANSFLTFQYNVDDPDVNMIVVRGQLTTTTNIHFERTGSGPIIDLSWYVVEYPSIVSSQRGGLTMTATTNNVTIASVDTSKSFSLASWEVAGVSWGDGDTIRHRLTSATNLEFLIDVLPGGFEPTIDWEVVEFAGAVVQRGITTFASVTASEDIVINSVDLSRSIVHLSNTINGDIAIPPDDHGLTGQLTTPTNLHIQRDGTGHSMQIAWEVTEFPPNVKVQSGSESLGTSQTVANVAITSVDLSRTAVLISQDMKSGRTNDSVDDNPHTVWYKAELTTATNLQLTRAASVSSTGDVVWYVIEFGPKQNACAEIDALLAGTEPFTIDALLIKRQTETFTVDAILQKEQVFNFTVDGLKQATPEELFTIDAFLQDTFVEDFEVDARLKEVQTKTFTIDARIAGAERFDVDSIIVDRNTETFDVDAFLQAEQVFDFTVDALLQQEQDEGFLINAFLQDTFTEDFSVDAILKATFTETFEIDAFLQAEQVFNFTVDGLKEASPEEMFTIDAFLQETFIEDFEVNSIVVNRNTETFTINSILVNRNTETFTINSIIVDRNTKDFEIDSIVVDRNTETFTIDSIVVDRNTEDFLVDAKIVRIKLFDIDARLVDRNTEDFEVDAFPQAEQTEVFTIDAFIQALGQVFNFTVDAFPQKEKTKLFLVDSFLRDTFTEDFEIDSKVIVRNDKTFIIDVHLEPQKLFVDSFNRPDSITLGASDIPGNNWIEIETVPGVGPEIVSNKMEWLSVQNTNNNNEPIATNDFTKQTSGKIKWQFEFDFDRGSDNDFRLTMQLGDGALFVNPNTSHTTGVAVNLQYASASRGMTDLEGFGHGFEPSLVQDARTKGLVTVDVTADFGSQTYNINLRGAGLISGAGLTTGIPFVNSVGIDTIRIYSDLLSAIAFADKKFDDMCVFKVFETTESFSVDAILKEVQTEQFTVDALLQDTFTEIFTVDGLKSAGADKFFLINAFLQAQQEKEVDIDVLIATRVAFNYTVDSIQQATFTKDFTTDALPQAEQTKVFSVDAVLAEIKTKDFSVDGFLTENPIFAFTIDSFLQKEQTLNFIVDSFVFEENVKNILVDSLLRKEQTKQFTVGAKTKATQTENFDIDSLIQILGQTETFSIDAVLSEANTKIFSVDSKLRAVQTETFDIDARLFVFNTTDFTVDGRIAVTRNFTTDSLLIRAEKFNVNVFLKGEVTKTFSVDGLTFIPPAVLHCIDAKLIVRKTTTFAVDTFNQGVNTKPFSIDAVLEAVQTKDFIIDANLTEAATQAFTVDARVTAVPEKTYVIDSLLQETGKTITFDIDTFSSKTKVTGFNIDGLIKALGQTTTFDIDTLGQVFNTVEFTLDAVFPRQQFNNRTIDALLKELGRTFEFSVGARTLGIQTTNFDVDAILKAEFTTNFRVDGISFITPSALICIGPIIQFTATETAEIDSKLINRKDTTFSIDAVLAEIVTNTKDFTVDAPLLLEGNTTNFNIDSTLFLFTTTTFIVDAMPKRRSQRSFLIDTTGLFSERTEDLTVDSILKPVQIKTFSVDAILEKTQTELFDVNTLLASRLTRTFSIDGITFIPPSAVICVGGIPKALGQTEGFTLEAHLRLVQSETFDTDSILLNIVNINLSVDALLQDTFTKATTIDAKLVRTNSFSIDALIQRLGINCRSGLLLNDDFNSDTGWLLTATGNSVNINTTVPGEVFYNIFGNFVNGRYYKQLDFNGGLGKINTVEDFRIEFKYNRDFISLGNNGPHLMGLTNDTDVMANQQFFGVVADITQLRLEMQDLVVSTATTTAVQIPDNTDLFIRAEKTGNFIRLIVTTDKDFMVHLPGSPTPFFDISGLETMVFDRVGGSSTGSVVDAFAETGVLDDLNVFADLCTDFGVGAKLLDIPDQSFTIDAKIVNRVQFEVGTKLKATINKDFIVDAGIGVNKVEFNVDSILAGIKEFGIDVRLVRAENIIIDSIISSRKTLDYEVDLITLGIIQESFTIDAKLIKGQSFSLGAIFSTIPQQVNFSLVHLQDITPIFGGIVDFSFKIDALLRGQITFNVDARLRMVTRFDVDTVLTTESQDLNFSLVHMQDVTPLFNLQVMVPFDVDVLLSTTNLRTFSVDALLFFENAETFDIDSELIKLFATEVFDIDTLLLSVNPFDILVDSKTILRNKTDFTIDTFSIGKAQKNVEIDSFIKREGITNEFTIDARIIIIQTNDFNINAVVKLFGESGFCNEFPEPETFGTGFEQFIGPIAPIQESTVQLLIGQEFTLNNEQVRRVTVLLRSTGEPNTITSPSIIDSRIWSNVVVGNNSGETEEAVSITSINALNGIGDLDAGVWTKIDFLYDSTTSPFLTGTHVIGILHNVGLENDSPKGVGVAKPVISNSNVIPGEALFRRGSNTVLPLGDTWQRLLLPEQDIVIEIETIDGNLITEGKGRGCATISAIIQAPAKEFTVDAITDDFKQFVFTTDVLLKRLGENSICISAPEQSEKNLITLMNTLDTNTKTGIIFAEIDRDLHTFAQGDGLNGQEWDDLNFTKPLSVEIFVGLGGGTENTEGEESGTGEVVLLTRDNTPNPVSVKYNFDGTEEVIPSVNILRANIFTKEEAVALETVDSSNFTFVEDVNDVREQAVRTKFTFDPDLTPFVSGKAFIGSRIFTNFGEIPFNCFFAGPAYVCEWSTGGLHVGFRRTVADTGGDQFGGLGYITRQVKFQRLHDPQDTESSNELRTLFLPTFGTFPTEAPPSHYDWEAKILGVKQSEGIQPLPTSTNGENSGAACFAIDACIDGLGTKERFTVDAVLDQGVKEFIVDSVILLAPGKTYTLDSILLGIQQEIFEINSLIQITKIAPKFNINAKLQLQGEIETFSIDAILNFQGINKQFFVDGLKIDTPSRLSIMDAFVKAFGQTEVPSVDSVLLKEQINGFSVDAIIILPSFAQGFFFLVNARITQQVENTEEFDVTASLATLTFQNFSIDAQILRDDHRFRTDAILMKTQQVFVFPDVLLAETFTTTTEIDALLKGFDIEKQFTVDTFNTLANIETFSVDSKIRQTDTIEYTVDAVLKGSVKEEFLLDVILSRISTILTDSIVKALGDGDTGTGNSGGTNENAQNPFVEQDDGGNFFQLPIGTLAGQRLRLPTAPVRITGFSVTMFRDIIAGVPMGTLTGKVYKNSISGSPIVVGDLIATSDNVINIADLTTSPVGQLVTFTFTNPAEITEDDNVFVGFDIDGSNVQTFIETETTGTVIPGGDLNIEFTAGEWGADLGVDLKITINIDDVPRQRASLLIDACVGIRTETFIVDARVVNPLTISTKTFRLDGGLTGTAINEFIIDALLRGRSFDISAFVGEVFETVLDTESAVTSGIDSESVVGN